MKTVIVEPRAEVIESTSLAHLKTPDEYRALRENIFPSDTALRWQIRQHREELMARGALVVLRGRLFIHDSQFDKLIQEIGARPISKRSGVAA